uniref:Uncharacterized protein n=1 Tax=Arundo donax TaxID=35708 RepID=A0A0A9DF14_ARUDO
MFLKKLTKSNSEVTNTTTLLKFYIQLQRPCLYIIQNNSTTTTGTAYQPIYKRQHKPHKSTQ